MRPAHLIQLVATVNALGEHLELLQESKTELIKALQETTDTANSLRLLLKDARQLLSELSSRAEMN